MGYDIFKFGAVNLGDKIQLVPKQPVRGGDIPSYDGEAAISLGPAGKEESITWIKPNGLNLLIADRVLLNKVSWEDLDKNGFVKGKPILINGQYFRCRLLQVGESKNAPNEWDKVMDKTYEVDILWHWDKMSFWGTDMVTRHTQLRAVRGYYSARYWDFSNAASQYVHVGFRPAFEPLPSDNPDSNINLDGVDFQLTSLPGSNAFCPILQPMQENVFKDIPVGGKARMYTFLEGGKPIRVGATVKDISKLTLTDRYYGDEYLVPWTISNGIAVASQSIKQQI